MPRFFFNLNFATETVADPDGADIADIDAAKIDARDAIREIAAQYLKVGKPLTLASISVCDMAGNEVAMVKTEDALG